MTRRSNTHKQAGRSEKIDQTNKVKLSTKISGPFLGDFPSLQLATILPPAAANSLIKFSAARKNLCDNSAQLSWYLTFIFVRIEGENFTAAAAQAKGDVS